MAGTKIEWADAVWNPITGCTPISEGCDHCYAKRMANRLKGRYGYPADDSFRVTFHPDRLGEPAEMKKPRRTFVCSMADIFHDDVENWMIDQVFAVMAAEYRHTYILLTKRPERAMQYLESEYRLNYIYEQWYAVSGKPREAEAWPLPNVWIGVTAENQARADERIPALLQIPAAVRFVSVEPMLGPVGLSRATGNTSFDVGGDFPQDRTLDWVICGGETGPGARPMHPDWVRWLRDQCQAAGVPFFFKQWGEWCYGCDYYEEDDDVRRRIGKKAAGRLLDGREWNEFPEVAR